MDKWIEDIIGEDKKSKNRATSEDVTTTELVNLATPKEYVGVSMKTASNGGLNIVGMREKAETTKAKRVSQVDRILDGLQKSSMNKNETGFPVKPRTTLFDVWIYTQTTILITTSVRNLTFDIPPIVAKPGSKLDPYCDVPVLLRKRTAIGWNSNFQKGKNVPVEWFYHNFFAILTEPRGTLPIVIDPGNQNGGTAGWPS